MPEDDSNHDQNGNRSTVAATLKTATTDRMKDARKSERKFFFIGRG